MNPYLLSMRVFEPWWHLGVHLETLVDFARVEETVEIKLDQVLIPQKFWRVHKREVYIFFLNIFNPVNIVIYLQDYEFEFLIHILYRKKIRCHLN